MEILLALAVGVIIGMAAGVSLARARGLPGDEMPPQVHTVEWAFRAIQRMLRQAGQNEGAEQPRTKDTRHRRKRRGG